MFKVCGFVSEFEDFMLFQFFCAVLQRLLEIISSLIWLNSLVFIDFFCYFVKSENLTLFVTRSYTFCK